MAETTIRSDLIRGSIDAMLLRVLSAHDSYGYEIIKTITQRTGGRYELKEPSLYTSLKRLERDGCVQSYWGDASQGRAGSITALRRRARRCCTTRWSSGARRGTSLTVC